MRTIVIAAVLVVIAAGSVHAGEPGETILDEASPFRCHFRWATPLVRKGDDLKPFTKRVGWGDLVCDTPPPAAGWTATDFDDGGWVHWKGPALRHARLTPAGYSGKVLVYDYGLTMFYKYQFDYARSPALALQCMRGRFTVDDPRRVRNLKLSLAYRGGAVVYVNGKEIARGHLPAGGVAADTLAKDYPTEAFLKPGGRKPLTTYASDSGRFSDRLRLRVRRLENIAIPASALCKGTNVLAVEVHRAPYIAKKGAMNWGTCCLIRLKMTAAAGVRPNVSKLTGLRVWPRPTTTFTTPLDCPDPHEPLAPLRIIAARNGSFTGQVIVGSDKPIRRLAATASELKQVDGDGGIPASAVKILYPSMLRGHAPRFDPLAETPPAEVPPIKLSKRLKGKGLHPAAVQPIWLKVRVSADAAPGEYRGTLTIRAPRRIAVPVELKVIDWRLPDPKDYATHVALVQSPDTLALTYDTPQWSEKHWTLIER